MWDLPKACVGSNDSLKLTLTGHISTIRGLVISDRSPYLFSVSEDKTVKCWDLEVNRCIRHYHGHLSAVNCCALHPTLDLLITGGRDAVCRVWDIRSRQQVCSLGGHSDAVTAILTDVTDPQIISASRDGTVKLWDLRGGKEISTLTNHKKGVRTMCKGKMEHTFLSASQGDVRKWACKSGELVGRYYNHEAVINTMDCNEEGVVVTGGDDGSIHFYDYKTGYTFQKTESIVQPGSLQAENSVFTMGFDFSGTRLITGEGDKTIKIWKEREKVCQQDEEIDMKGWRRDFLKQQKIRF